MSSVWDCPEWKIRMGLKVVYEAALWPNWNINLALTSLVAWPLGVKIILLVTSRVPCGLNNVTLSHYLGKITPPLTPWPSGWLVVSGHPYLEPSNTQGSLEPRAKACNVPNWNFNQWHSLPLSPSPLPLCKCSRPFSKQRRQAPSCHSVFGR